MVSVQILEGAKLYPIFLDARIGKNRLLESTDISEEKVHSFFKWIFSYALFKNCSISHFYFLIQWKPFTTQTLVLNTYIYI